MNEPAFHVYDRVYIEDDEHCGKRGTVVETFFDGEPDLYVVHLDGEEEEIVLTESEMEIDWRKEGG